jgi:DNA-binding NtrC family response regulator
MIAWAPMEPERVGEVALFDVEGGARILGRGEPERGGTERVVFFRQRPGSVERRPPLSSPGLSREQLRIRVDRGKLRVEQIGKCALEFGGRRVDQCVVAPGESFLLKGQLLLSCILRPRKLEPLRAASLDGAFGAPDAHGIVGESAAVWRLRDQLAWMGKADGHTLLLGGSGSGKELCARAVHASSTRARGPFIARNAATIPAGIIDAELFGNVKNYPNPGMAERPGLIGSADGGTLFLDEIGELPQSLQANLLRVLDEGGEYHNLGATTTKRSNFRLLGATNRDPITLKHDLAARLVLRVLVPGLDERREDIPLLVRHLLRRAMTKSPDAVSQFFTTVNGSPEPNLRASLVEKLMAHSYTTNIRELDALLWRAMSTSMGKVIEWPKDMLLPTADALEEWSVSPENGTEAAEIAEPVKEPSEAEVRESLGAHDGNIVRAARALGLSSRYVLYRLMRKYGIVAT